MKENLLTLAFLPQPYESARKRRGGEESLDQVLGAEVCPQVHDLPRPETDEEPGGGDAEPLDTGVCGLVGVTELLLALAEVLHLADELAAELLDAAELGLDGLELLGGLDGGPVLGVGADVDVELDGAGGRVRAAAWRHQKSDLFS